MSEQRPVNLCEDCPLRELLPDGDEAPDKERYLSDVGERTVPRSWIEADGSAAHFEIDNVSGPKEVEVAVLSDGVTTGPAFYVSKGIWRRGTVENSFEQCEEPNVIKSGFLKRRKQPVCGALKLFLDQ